MVSKQRLYQLAASILLLTAAFNSIALEQLTASIDRNPVMVNEAFVLTVTADDSIGTNELDTSALLKDFVVGRTSSGSSMQMINGDTTRTTTWTLVLMAKKEGTFAIPAFSIDGVTSNSIQMNVVKAGKNRTATQQNDAFLEAIIDEGPFYPQQTFRYQLNFFYATAIQSGQLSEPSVEGALIEKVDSDTESSEIINGKRYKVFTRFYAITPQQAGEYTIQPVRLQGEQVVQQNRRSFFSSLANTKPITLFSKPVNFSVQPKPDYAGANWLPVELLNLHEEWQPEANEHQVGEPITRTITLTALGAKAEQLPELEIAMPSGVKAYPENPELNTMNREGRVIGQRKETLAIIPTQPGTVTFPEVTVTWFNTKAKRQEQETLPAKTIVITGGVTAPDNTVAPPVVSESATPPAQLSDTQNQPSSQEVIIWRALCTFFALAWVITLWLWWSTKKQLANTKVTVEIEQEAADTSTEILWQKFSQACANQQGNVALIALLDWAKLRLPNQHFQSAEDLAKRLQNPALLEAIQQGQKALYSSNPKQFNWQVLPRLLKAAIGSQREKQSKSSLPPLNP